MKVWTIPDNIRRKKDDWVSKQQYVADHAPDFIKEHTGLTPSALNLTGYCQFKSDDSGVPSFLKKDRDGVISPRMSSKRGKEFAALWLKKFGDKITRPLFLHLFSHFKGRLISFRIDTINGVEYIVDCKGVDLVAEGCVEVDI